MSVFFEKIMPNVVAYWDRFTTSCGQTLQMFAIAGVFTFIFGLIFGVILTVTKRDGIRQNLVIYYIVDIFTNVFRSIPFIILLIFLYKSACGNGDRCKGCCGSAYIRCGSVFYKTG